MTKATLRFRIEQEEIDKLNEIAIDERLTLSDIARRAIYEFTTREGYPETQHSKICPECGGNEVQERHIFDRGLCRDFVEFKCADCGTEWED